MTEARKTAGWIPMTAEVTADLAAVHAAMHIALDRSMRPWLYPDPNPFPALVPLPALAAAQGLPDQWRALHDRIRNAWDALRGHRTDDDDWDEW